MDELDRYQPTEWEQDGIVFRDQLRGGRLLKRPTSPSAGWLASAASAAMVFSMLAVGIPSGIVLPPSSLTQEVIVAPSHPEVLYSELREVAPDHWAKLIRGLDRYPKDLSADESPDPDPIT